MDTLQQFFATFTQAWQQADLGFLLGFGLLFILVWFLPSLLALGFNRQHVGKIAMLNIPAGFS